MSSCCDISEKKNMVILFTFGTVIRYHVLLMLVKYHLALCHIWVIMATCYIVCMFVVIIQRRMDWYIYIWYSNQWILFMLGTLINLHRVLVNITYSLALCQNRVLMSIMSIMSWLLCILLISHIWLAKIILILYSDYVP